MSTHHEASSMIGGLGVPLQEVRGDVVFIDARNGNSGSTDMGIIPKTLRFLVVYHTGIQVLFG
jgi:hypothetical protein